MIHASGHNINIKQLCEVSPCCSQSAIKAQSGDSSVESVMQVRAMLAAGDMQAETAR